MFFRRKNTRFRRQSLPACSFLSKRQGGFALIVALSLMGFLLLLLLSLSALVSVELAGIQQSKAKLAARENARLGLLAALGELQVQAGPDQRVTARADISDSTLTGGTRFWTGVWDSANTTSPMTWLVSGENPDPASTPSGNNTVSLVGEATVGTTSINPNANNQKIVVESVPAEENGRYAWWIGDEGVKANISHVGSEDIYPEPANQVDVVKRHERGINFAQNGARVGVEALVGTSFSESGEFRQTHEGTSHELARALHLSDLMQVNNLKDDFMPRYFHDLTVHSSGVLADSVNGGLRMNLDNPVGTDPNDPFTNGDLNAYINHQANYTSFQTERYWTTYGLDAVDQMAEDWENNMPEKPEEGYRAYHHLTPIITEFIIYFSVFHRPSDGGHPGIRYQLELELYNPYPFPILLSSSDRKPLTVMVEGLPEIKVTKNPVSGASVSSGWVAMDDLPLSSSSGDVETSSWLEITDSNLGDEGEQDSVGFLMPGEVYRLNEPNRVGGLLKYMRGYQPKTVEDADEIVVECRAPDGEEEGKLNVKLIKGYTYKTEGINTRTAGDPSVFELKNLPYEGNPDYFYFVYDRADGKPAGGRGTAGDKKYIQGSGNQGSVEIDKTYIFAFHFRLGAGIDSPELEEFLKYYDLRNPSIDYEGSFSYIDEDGNEVTRAYADFIDQASFNPISTETFISKVLSREPTFDAFWDLQSRYRDPEAAAADRYQDLRLYDVPTQSPTNIASLRHAYFVGTAPLSLTSPNGGGLNDAFDKYFFSSIPDTGWTPDSKLDLPNPYMRVVDETQSTSALRAYDSAQYLMVDSAFNINSTSFEAWAAVLDQGTTDYSLDEGDRQGIFIKRTSSNGVPSDIDLENYFFRFPFGALEYNKALGDSPLEGTDDVIGLKNLSGSELLRESTRQGFRSLNSSEGDQQIQQLAYRIVEGIKARGQPFGSVSEFINSGIVEDAIEAVGPAVTEVELPEVTPINEGIKSFAPVYVRQSDVISTIASHMSARSDTFLIRSYGDYRDPLSDKIISTALIEAVVQRVPEIIGDGTTVVDPMSNATEINSGRAFKIVSMRWIND